MENVPVYLLRVIQKSEPSPDILRELLLKNVLLDYKGKEFVVASCNSYHNYGYQIRHDGLYLNNSA